MNDGRPSAKPALVGRAAPTSSMASSQVEDALRFLARLIARALVSEGAPMSSGDSHDHPASGQAS